VPEEFEPNLQLQVSAYIPDDYVGDVAHRLVLYKRLTASTQVGDLAQLHGELVDRYGAPPEPVERLFEVMEIRLLAKALRVAAIQVRPTAVAFGFDVTALPPQAGLQALMDQYHARLRFTTPASFELLGVDLAWKGAFPEIKRALQVLASYDKKSIASA
jgi:transcription-repair coupling factor (superfamily II helicase)